MDWGHARGEEEGGYEGPVGVVQEVEGCDDLVPEGQRAQVEFRGEGCEDVCEV